jgi:zinc protease
VLRVSVQTKNPSAPEVVGLIHAELDRLMNTPVPADELAARKANLIGGFSRSLETTSGLADQVEALQVAGLPASDLVQRIPQLEEVSISDVQAFAMKRFGTAARRAVVAGVAGEFEAGLRPMAPKIVVVPQDKLDLEAGAPQ